MYGMITASRERFECDTPRASKESLTKMGRGETQWQQKDNEKEVEQQKEDEEEEKQQKKEEEEKRQKKYEEEEAQQKIED
ncbi:hypothetical protein PoB_000264000 [Plakobranchus ocellatus]|uniref:Uncharacterized protein n=1 Tax=Plakobranchus ocellatus TaxID=259542 RepID=A0AAV3Y0C5_9GAST|nr:hypothetical protein PoB_000264000 [Plakobranchus ocellatus]